MKKVFLYLTVLLTVIGCSQTTEIDIVMNQAERIMETRQDDANKSLIVLDSLKAQINGMTEAQRMRYHLLQAKAMNKAYVDFTSDSIMLKVVDYYERYGSGYEKMTANYLLGCVYRDLGDAPTAMKYLERATKSDGKDIPTYKTLAHIHSQMAYLLEEQSLAENALRELDVAYKYSILAGDTIDALTILSVKAPVYSLVNKMDSSEIVIDSCINMFKRMGCQQYAAQMCAYNIRYLLQKGEIGKAHERIKIYETESGYFHNGEIESGKEVYYYYKGLYYLSVNHTDSARTMFQKCLNYIADPNIKVSAYHGLSLLYDKIGPADSTAKYALLAYNANDSAYDKSVSEALIRQQALYNYSKHQETALRSAERAATLGWWLFASLAVLVAVVCSTSFIYKKKKRAAGRRIAMMQERYETEKTLLQREMEEMNALLEERQSLLETKEDLLERREAELNIEIGKREQSIAELQERVAGYEREMHIKDIAVLEDEIQKAPLKDDFSYYLKNVMEQPSSKDWDKLIRFAKSNFPKLYVMLRNYNVSERELRICLLTRLMFKPKDIAVLVGCRFPEVSLTRSRLLKKIYGIDGKASDFDKRIILMY
jgi:tetratricopeptide (TPR) repeat protein